MPFFVVRGRTWVLAAVLAGGALAVDACVGDEPAVTDTDAGNGAADGSSGSDASTGDASTDSGGAVTTYASSLADESLWEQFDVAPLASTGGFIGGAFDGRYVYYVPNKQTTLLRYDTKAPFGNVGSWDAYDLSAFNAEFNGALFASPYLYLIPVGGTNTGTLVRFDTRADFKIAGSYTAFDMTRVNPSDHTFSPGAYDGKFAYFGPVGGANAARVDTTSNFEADASYQSFAFNPAAYYTSTCFDGTHVYFVPAASGTGQGIGTLRQYSTKGSFTAGGSFLTFDTADGGVDPKAAGFKGCAFDGKYLYLEPYGNNGATQGFASLVVRYDTTLGFTDVSSYSKFDLNGVDANAKGFSGSTFDGRYLYFAPYTKSTAVRFDTTGSFGDKGAWQSFDLTTTLTAAATGYAGAVFDGQHVYFVPYGTTLAVRFDAKSPASLPAFSSSFY